MPLRALVSHSETISAPCQCRTLETLSKAPRMAYSASGPPHRHTARRSTTGHTMRSARTSPSAVVVTSPVVAILTVLTRQKSHHSTAISTAKEIGCYRARGRGRGCDPAHISKHPARPYEGCSALDLSGGNQRYGVVNEPCFGPVEPLLLDLLSINKYRPETY